MYIILLYFIRMRRALFLIIIIIIFKLCFTCENIFHRNNRCYALLIFKTKKSLILAGNLARSVQPFRRFLVPKKQQTRQTSLSILGRCSGFLVFYISRFYRDCQGWCSSSNSRLVQSTEYRVHHSILRVYQHKIIRNWVFATNSNFLISIYYSMIV